MKFFDYIKDIEDFAEEIGIQVQPYPEVKLDKTEQDLFDPFIQTGNYNCNDQTITLFITNRHLKDILMSFCHELIHHNQFLTMNDKYIEAIENSDTPDVNGNPLIEEIEADAYERGNLLIRKWTETKQSEGEEN